MRDEDGDEDLVSRAGKLAGRAVSAGYSVGKRLPGADTAERTARSAERTVLRELRKRLDAVDDTHRAGSSQGAVTSRNGTDGAPTSGAARSGGLPELVTVVPTEGGTEPLRAAMAELLNHSIGFGVDRSREYLYAVILRQLTPDEARIMAALADGEPYPAVDIAERSAFGGTGRVLLRNASTIGKSAGIALLDHVSSYVTRLAGLGLVELAEETSAMETQYEILLTESSVRAAIDSAKRPRVLRHTVRVSTLGTEFWQACDPMGPSVTGRSR